MPYYVFAWIASLSSALILIIVAGVFATIDEKFHFRSFFNPSIGIGLLAMVFLALNNAFIKLALVKSDVWTTNLWMGIISLFLLMFTIPLFRKDILKVKIN